MKNIRSGIQSSVVSNEPPRPDDERRGYINVVDDGEVIKPAVVNEPTVLDNKPQEGANSDPCEFESVWKTEKDLHGPLTQAQYHGTKRMSKQMCSELRHGKSRRESR